MTNLDSNPLATGTHTIELNGITQRYHVHGTGPVCVAHSGGPGVFWEYLRMPQAEEHLTMVYVEPIGTGGSGRLASHPNGYTRDRYAEALDGLLDHFGTGPVYLLGHSHGGFVVQRYALKHPERLAGIILYDSAPLTGPEHGAELMRNVETFLARNAGNPDLPEVLGTLKSISAISTDEGMTAALAGIIPLYVADYWNRQDEFVPLRAQVSGTYISGVDEHGVPDLIDDRGVLGSISLPTLVIVGRYDPICGLRWAEELHKLIPGSELAILEHSGHFGHLEEPENFARALERFTRSRSTAATSPA
ncbi:alpha/beta hydrolase [Streptomyces sp. SID13031]|uniref:alpha/beta fold hydrolase n=1 Tax=Streptomyces sp. SID13031 TaxID=2706046 RepID=UPI001EF3AE8B|nr:alpha/beta hydrolase [Streptomyces sp. SID13031]